MVPLELVTKHSIQFVVRVLPYHSVCTEISCTGVIIFVFIHEWLLSMGHFWFKREIYRLTVRLALWLQMVILII